MPLLSIAQLNWRRAHCFSVEPGARHATSSEGPHAPEAGSSSVQQQQERHKHRNYLSILQKVAPSIATRLSQRPSAERDLGGLRAASGVAATTKAAVEYAATYPKVHANINGKQVEVPTGTSILEAARSIGVHIPTLCTHPRLVAMGTKAPGTCRLCLVDVRGRLVPACATPVHEGLEVETDTQQVKGNVVGVLAMLRANHPNDCMKCESSGRCEFQDLITRYRVDGHLPKLRDFSHEWDEQLDHEFVARHDDSTASLLFDFDKCLKCGRCVTACNAIQNVGVLGMVDRGRHRHPGKLSDTPLDFTKCIECGQCSSVCPTDAIHERPHWQEVLDIIESGRKTVVVQSAPAVRVAIGEEVGLAPGEVTTGQMVAAQRALGFNYVFDTNFSADVTIMEEGTELLKRLQAKWAAQEAGGQGQAAHQQAGSREAEEEQEGPLPLFTSCCPAWINAVEKSYPELIPHLSTCKSPQMMLGAIIKRVWAPEMGLDPHEVVSVSIMPCTAKKHEATMHKFTDPASGAHDVDFVLTTREFGQMLRHCKVPLASLATSEFDSALGSSTGAAALFGASGGVMEAAVRTVYALVTGRNLPRLELDAVRGLQGVKEATLSLKHPEGGGIDREVRVAVASGIGNARHLLERMRKGEVQYDVVEVMACPAGCIGGGGQPKSSDPAVLLKRMGGIYAIDKDMPMRQSHENKEVARLYESDLEGAPGSHRAHHLLHTQYEDLSQATVPRYGATAGPASPNPEGKFFAEQEAQRVKQ